MTICIFSFTFNPIHKAHVKMAEFALEHYGFEKIIFIPSYIPPHKDLDPELARHRLNMVKLATAGNPKFEVSDIEYQNKGKSYTLNTVKKIIEEYNIQGKLNFIIGTDAFENINTWYKAYELKQRVHFIVFPRGTVVSPKAGFDYEQAPMNYINISSTEIRKDLNSVTIKKVKDYIKENDLYLS